MCYMEYFESTSFAWNIRELGEYLSIPMLFDYGNEEYYAGFLRKEMSCTVEAKKRVKHETMQVSEPYVFPLTDV